MIQLKEFISSIINSFLGPNKANKFVIQEKDICITRCPVLIFQNVHFQNPLSSVIEETLFAHHDLYGCSTLSLLGMWYLWNEEFKLAINEGCRVQDIIKHSHNILEQVISAVSSTAVKFDEMISKRQKLVRKVHKIPDQVPISIQYSSRHFSPAGKFSNLENSNGFDMCSELDERCLEQAVKCLNHDDNEEISDLILKCWKRQASSFTYSKFSADTIHICPIVLPCSSSTVIDGLVIKSYLNNSWCHDMKSTRSKRSLLIKGSITYEYVHLGFSPKVKLSIQQTSAPTAITNKEIWIKSICKFIKQLNLDVLLIKDDIEPEIASFCSAHSVLVLSNIPLILLKKLCNVLQYSPCTYITDCREDDIIRNLVVSLWKPHGDISLSDQYFLVNINSENEVKMQTIVLCHPFQSVLESIEHQMHHLISRLSLSFESNTLLPGGGVSEEWCFEFLNKLPQFHDLSDPTSRIMRALANGLRNYATVVLQKKTLSTNNESNILDETSSKLNAWRSALSLLLLTFQCDSIIINGADDLHI